MKKYMKEFIALSVLIIGLIYGCVSHSKLDNFVIKDSSDTQNKTVQENNREWIRYGNLYKKANNNVDYTIAQSKVDIEKDLGVPGLTLQEGFLNSLLKEAYISLDQPSLQQVENSLKDNNVLVLIDPDSEAGKELTKNYSGNNSLEEMLKSQKNNAEGFTKVNAFVLEKGKRKLFVISSADQKSMNLVKEIIGNTEEVIKNYDMHRGWFGASTTVKSVTCTPGHYLDVIGKGMNEGNDWFVFSGGMDFLSKDDLMDWMGKVKLPVVTDVGTSPIYGCKNYDGVQVQGLYTGEQWVKIAHEKGGYAFRAVADTQAKLPYDGYIASNSRGGGRSAVSSSGEEAKKKIDRGDVPFISSTGGLLSDAIPCMVLFAKKGEQWTKEQLWESILSRREVSVLNAGKMMGPALYRNALEMLVLDRVFIEEYFGDRVSIDAVMKDYQLNVTLTNMYSHAISGNLDLTVPPELKLMGDPSSTLNLPANSTKTLVFNIQPGVDAMNNANPIAVHYDWGTSKKSTIAMLNLPPAISVYQLLYGQSPAITYPVTIHNFTEKASFPVKVEVLTDDQSKKIVAEDTQTCSTGMGTFKTLTFELKVSPGKYRVKVTALGSEHISQLGVGDASGTASLSEIDLDGDGVNEIRMENDNVRVTVLRTGARVIEYIVKNRNDNVLFKLWPRKAVDDIRPFRRRGYYPFGGFEDFLGQGSMETWKVYDAEIVKKEGDYVQVKLTADYYGNKLVKTYTLYGNSPLLEAKFALNFINPEANVIGPQPIVDLGKRHWTEDQFNIPEISGMQKFRMTPEWFYGRALFLKEGWWAGHDDKEDITLVGAFPVSQPYFLHMFMNHPINNDSHYYYVEFQPWVQIYQKSTFYFTTYFWAASGPWEDGVKALKERNLITQR